MKVTINQIAEKAGVSRGTVDRVLNKRGRVREEVEQKVLQIAEDLGYVPVQHKRKNPSGHRRIGVITILSGSDFMKEIHRGLKNAKEEAEASGVEVVVRESNAVDEAEQLSYIEEMVALQVSGLAIMPVNCEPVRSKLTEVTEKHHIPVVTFNTDIQGTGRCCYVGMNNRQSGAVAAGLMHMLTGGSGSILLITGHFANALSNSRVDGFIETMKKDCSGLRTAGVQCSFDDPAEVERIILEACGSIPDVKGIFVVSGGQEGVLSAYEKLQASEWPHMIVYDRTERNEEALRRGIVDFVIDQNTYQQGYQAIRVLADALDGGKTAEGDFRNTGINIRTKYNIED